MPIDGKIQHRDDLFVDIGAQLQNTESSDVTLIVESKPFYCHKIILAARSKYFKALLYGKMKETHELEIPLLDISSAAFQLLLNYIYKSEMNLADLSVEEIFDIVHIVRTYGFESLEKDVISYLENIVSISNVLAVFEKATFFDLTSLVDVCSKYIDDHANEIIKHKNFNKLSMFLVKEILHRNTFVVNEVGIFGAVRDWIECNKPLDDELQDVLNLVRMPLISPEDLVNVVWPTKLYSDATILAAIKNWLNTTSEEIEYRGHSILEENVATSKHGSHASIGGSKIKESDEMPTLKWIFSLNFNNYSDVKITLGKAFLINCIKIHHKVQESDPTQEANTDGLSNFPKSPLKFCKLEASIDGVKYLSINNFQKYLCENWSMILFSTTTARYFNIIYPEGVNVSSEVDFIQCMNTNENPIKWNINKFENSSQPEKESVETSIVWRKMATGRRSNNSVK